MPPSFDPGAPDEQGPAAEELTSLLVGMTGNYRLQEKSSWLTHKVRRRLAENGLPSVGAYLDFIKQGEVGRRELDSLIAELTVGETFFFRHPEHFDTLRERVLPDCLERNAASRQLRIWSAGCANGAEAYSISIAVRSALAGRHEDWSVTIVGSDINRAFLAQGEAGRYSAWALRDMEQSQIERYLSRSGGSWSVPQRYKDDVRFVCHNLNTEEIPSVHKGIFSFDIVFCRNVLIYFKEELCNRLVQRLGETMAPNGWLFVAPADYTSCLDTCFVRDSAAPVTVYRKRSPQTPGPARRRTSSPTFATPRSRIALPPAKQAATPPARMPRHDNPARLAETEPAAAARSQSPTEFERFFKLADRGDWDAAMACCQGILQSDPLSAEAHYCHALILEATGAAGEVESALKRAIYLDHDFALAHYQLALARERSAGHAAQVKALGNALEALEGLPDDRTISPCGEITAAELRELVAQKLELLSRP